MKKKIKNIIAFLCFWLFSTFVLLMLRKPILMEKTWSNEGYREKMIPTAGFFDLLPNKMLQAFAFTVIVAMIYFIISSVIKFIKKPLSS